MPQLRIKADKLARQVKLARMYPPLMRIAAALFLDGFPEGCVARDPDLRRVLLDPEIIAIENYLRDYRRGNRDVDDTMLKLIKRY